MCSHFQLPVALKLRAAARVKAGTVTGHWNLNSLLPLQFVADDDDDDDNDDDDDDDNTDDGTVSGSLILSCRFNSLLTEQLLSYSIRSLAQQEFIILHELLVVHL